MNALRLTYQRGTYAILSLVLLVVSVLPVHESAESSLHYLISVPGDASSVTEAFQFVRDYSIIAVGVDADPVTMSNNNLEFMEYACHGGESNRELIETRFSIIHESGVTIRAACNFTDPNAINEF